MFLFFFNGNIFLKKHFYSEMNESQSANLFCFRLC